MGDPKGVLSWDVEAIAKALKISENDVREYFTDGRRVSFILERRLAKEVLHGKLAPTEGASYDLIDPEGNHWEVRSLTSRGIYFSPSYMVGSGRSFEESGFQRKLEDVSGFIVSDVESFPDIKFWFVRSEQVKLWWNKGLLGSTTKITRDRALALLRMVD